MAHDVDLLSWLRELDPREPWPYFLYEGFVRAYWRASPRRRAQADEALAGLGREMVRGAALMSPARRN